MCRRSGDQCSDRGAVGVLYEVVGSKESAGRGVVASDTGELNSGGGDYEQVRLSFKCVSFKCVSSEPRTVCAGGLSDCSSGFGRR